MVRGMIKVTGWCPPAIARVGNTTYVMPGWIPVPDNTTLDMVEWVRPVVKTPTMKTKHVGKYILKIYDNGKVTCDCPGFTYRRKCKHSAEYLV